MYIKSNIVHYFKSDVIGFAGIPAYNHPSLSKFFVTTEPAATIIFGAIVTPGCGVVACGYSSFPSVLAPVLFTSAITSLRHRLGGACALECSFVTNSFYI